MSQPAAGPGVDPNLSTFLTYAATRDIAVVGTIAAGATGGTGFSAVTWQQDIPEAPVWCKAIDYEVTLPITVTNTSTTSLTFQLSPFAPYSSFSNQFTIAGAPPWPMTELTPWYLDNLARNANFDESTMDPNWTTVASSLGNVGYEVRLNRDAGSLGQSVYQSSTVYPGATISVGSAGGSSTTPLVLKFTLRQPLQRFRKALWGTVPFGDPKNRPRNQFQLNTLVGTNPINNTVLTSLSTLTAAVTAGSTVNVIAHYRCLGIDILPPGVGTPTPTVGYGLALNPQNQSITTAGQIQNIEHIDSAAYLAMHHVLLNAAASGGVLVPTEASYFALWLTQEQRSARYAYDVSDSSFNDYFAQYARVHKEFPPLGVYVNDLVSGDLPELPSATPFEGIMSPDATYAASFGVAVTPNLHSAIAFASGTTLYQAQVECYNFEYVRVTY